MVGRSASATVVVLAAALAHADRNTECVAWARAGQCEANGAYMHRECAKECADTQVIVDQLGEMEQCAGWASQGECTRNPKFMLASCPKNCVAQRAAVHEAIVDDRITCLDQASEQSCAADEDLRTGCAGTCFTLATCHGEADTDECARALRCRELKDEDASCSAHVARNGCDARALKRCYLSCARADLAGLLRTYRNKYTVRTRSHGLLDDDAGPLGFVGGLSAEVGAAEGRSARGPPLPCWKGTPFDTRPAATCESPRAAVLQRWRAMAEPRCRALRQLTPRAARRRVLVGAAGASALGQAHNSSIPLNSPVRLAADLALPAGLEMVVVPVLASPKVRLVESFVDASEAEHIIRIGLPGMHRSLAGAREESIRTSTTAMLPTNDPVVAAITRRASVLTGYPVDYIEPLQLVRYTSGQRYEPHFDFGEACDYEENLSNGPRHVTMLVYLTGVPEEYGARTTFPKLGVSVAPVAHTALVFNDCLPNGEEDPRTLHGGAPPLEGFREAKIAINIWIRAAPWRRAGRVGAAVESAVGSWFTA